MDKGMIKEILADGIASSATSVRCEGCRKPWTSVTRNTVPVCVTTKGGKKYLICQACMDELDKEQKKQ